MLNQFKQVFVSIDLKTKYNKFTTWSDLLFYPQGKLKEGF